MKQNSSGFTVVELLIVIVVIGVLAALVIATYNETQPRARNVARIASAKELQKAINAYVVQEGAYPFEGGLLNHVCVGKGYSDWDGDGTPDCGIKDSNIKHPSSILDSELLKVVKTVPRVEVSDIKTDNLTLRGYVYISGRTIDGKTDRKMLSYWLEGIDRDCGLTGVLTSTGGVTWATNEASNTTANYDGKSTLCNIAINEPE